MNRIFMALMMMLAALALSGCGGGDDRHSQTITIDSSAFNGDIEFDSSTGIFTITENDFSLLAGEDPSRPPTAPRELRTFLDFPLRSVRGTVVQLAILDILINSVTVVPPGTSIPILIELVPYPPVPRGLGNVHFDRLASSPIAIQTSISSADVNRSVRINVTALVREALRLNTDFQIRISQNGGPAPGLIEIDNDLDFPLLDVTFF